MADESSNKPESRTVRRRKRDWLPWAILASLLLHAILVPLLAWLFSLQPIPARLPQQFLGKSTAITIERRNRPRLRVNEPHRLAHPRAVAQPHPATQPRVARAKPQKAAPPRPELTRTVARAAYQPPQRTQHPSFSQQLASQERDFAREAQRLHAQNNPLAVSSAAPNPAAFHQTQMDASGQYTQEEQAFAWLLPVRHWFHDDQSCYYVHYNMSTSYGGTEEGNIPWPICYPRDHDAMLPLNRSHNLPVPYPPPGFTLASGTYLTPFLRSIYDHKPMP